MLSKKATKIDEIFTVDLTLCSKCQIDGIDLVHLCGLLRKHKLYHDRTDWSQIRLEFRISCVTGNMRLHFLVCASGENIGIFYFNWNQLHYWKHMAARLVILCQVQKLYTLVLQFYSSPCHIRYTNAKSS